MDIPHECARARGPYVEVGMGERKEKKERKNTQDSWEFCHN